MVIALISPRQLVRSHTPRRSNRTPLFERMNGSASFERVMNQFRATNPYRKVDHFDEIRRAFIFANEKHKGQMRKDGKTPYVNHPVTVAYMAAKRGLGKTAIIVALLHDVIEDCRVSEDEIRLHFGSEVAKKVSLLTKPKLVGREWIFPDHDEYHIAIDECIRKEQKKQREEIYYQRLLHSGDITVILVKILDGINNLETIENLPDKKIEPSIEKMVNGVLWLVPRMLNINEVVEFLTELSKWGYSMPDNLLPFGPENGAVFLPSRRNVTLELLQNLGPTTGNYFSMYVDPEERFLDVGLPPSKGPFSLDQMRIIFGAHTTRSVSLVPEEIGAHEEIFRINGMEPNDVLKRLKIAFPGITE